MRLFQAFKAFVIVSCLSLLPSPSALAFEGWSDGKSHIRTDGDRRQFFFNDDVFVQVKIPQIIDARPLFKKGMIFPEFHACEITTRQAVEAPSSTVLIEATYFIRVREWPPILCNLVSAPQDGLLVRFEQTVLSPQGEDLVMKRFVVETWDKPIPLKWKELSNPNLLQENATAKQMLENATPPYETFEESRLKHTAF